MRLILTFFIGLCLLSVETMAKDAQRDDGGFGSARFSAQAPSALGGDVFSPADIEPAAGDEAGDEEDSDVTNKKIDLHESKHQPEPIIIKKDMSVR